MINYKLNRNRRSRSIRIRVDLDGSVNVSAPPLVPKMIVDRFVSKNQTWIERQLKRVKLKKEVYPVLDWEKGLVSYLGVLYYLKFNEEGKNNIEVGRKYMTVTPVTGLKKDMKPTLLKWLKLEGEKYIRENTKKWAQSMSLKPVRISFRQQKSRWGSCSSGGNLSFNWRLIHFDPKVIDYVIIHELAHLKHHNHSKSFWELVNKYDGNYKKKMKFLKNQVIEIE